MGNILEKEGVLLHDALSSKGQKFLAPAAFSQVSTSCPAGCCPRRKSLGTDGQLSITQQTSAFTGRGLLRGNTIRLPHRPLRSSNGSGERGNVWRAQGHDFISGVYKFKLSILLRYHCQQYAPKEGGATPKDIAMRCSLAGKVEWRQSSECGS